MFIDSIVAGLLVLALFKGWRNGLVMAIFSFLVVVVGLAAAVKLSAVAAAYLGENVSVSQRWLPFIAFAVVFLGVVLLVKLGAKLIEKSLQAVMLGWANRLGGFLFYALLYLFVFSILLFYAAKLNLVQRATQQASSTYPFLAALGPKVIEGLGVVLPFFKDMFVQLEGFFDGLAR